METDLWTATWVTAGEAYGGDSKFRPWLEERRIGYVVAVPPASAACGHTALIAETNSQVTALQFAGSGSESLEV